MSLRIDLIQPDEQRSASPIGLKVVGRLALIGLVAGVSAYAALNITSITALSRQLRSARTEWDNTKPRRADAATLIQEVKENLATDQEISGWMASRLAWSGQLLAVARLVPPEMQLTSLSIQHDFQIVGGKTTARAFNLALDGRCTGRGSEGLVQSLKESLHRDSVTGPLIETVEVARFREDPLNEQDRLFQITVKYRPRSL